MSKPIIEVNNISKKYRLGNIGVGSFLDDLKGIGKKIGLPCSPPDPAKQFLALDDVSFTVKEGEVLGIIGHNGAGKSTLLKILSRITEPTSGSAVLRGRVASLLEVGTGFHGELSGIDNIYLNGSLNGLSKKEIKKKIDEIIEFSQIEDFINTPVKRYSSGMYVRLAFSVAAFLNPEILFIDEVLAVGDYAFKRKCIAKMKALSQKEGKTIVLVSHISSIIEQLATRCILLEKGKVINDGKTKELLKKYHEQISSTDQPDLHDFDYDTIQKSKILKKYIHLGGDIFIQSKSDKTFINSLHVSNDKGLITNVFETFDDIYISFNGACDNNEKDSYIFVRLIRDDGDNIWWHKFDPNKFSISETTKKYSFKISENNLCPGTYILSIRIAGGIGGLASSFPVELKIINRIEESSIAPMPEFRKVIPRIEY